MDLKIQQTQKGKIISYRGASKDQGTPCLETFYLMLFNGSAMERRYWIERLCFYHENGRWHLRILSTSTGAVTLRPVLSLSKERTASHPTDYSHNTLFVRRPSKPVRALSKSMNESNAIQLLFIGSTTFGGMLPLRNHFYLGHERLFDHG